jgi:hypothetical protein
VVQGGGGGTSWVGVSGVCWSAGGCADEAPWAVALRLCCPVHCVRGRRALERCLNSARWRVAVCAMCESECACCCCGWLQEVDLSANDISGEGVDRVRELLNGLPTASTCRVNLEDNDDGSGSDDGGSDSDISDIGSPPTPAGAVGGGGGGGGSAGAGGPAGSPPGVPAGASVPVVDKVLDVRGPRGALTAATAESLCAPILRCVVGVAGVGKCKCARCGEQLRGLVSALRCAGVPCMHVHVCV